MEKISVLMITYRQEDVVERTLDSLLKQKEYIYEICINDDCSPDGTWEILQDYAKRYPGLVKPVRNEPNVGIFRNTELSWERASGDLIYEIAGDDVCPDGYFEKVQNFISENNLDCRNEAFCIYSDYMQIEPDGHSITYRNNLVEKKGNAVKLAIRQLISARSATYSRKVLQQFVCVSHGRDFSVEGAQSIQVQAFAEKNYYLPTLGSIYYSGIGISAHIPDKERINSAILVFDRMLEFLEDRNLRPDSKDIAFMSFMKEYRYWGYEKGAKHLLLMLKYYLLSIDPSLGLAGLQLNRLLFILRKKRS